MIITEYSDRRDYTMDYAAPSNIQYSGERFKANVNMTATNTLCFVGGCIVGAAIAYYMLKNLDKNS